MMRFDSRLVFLLVAGLSIATAGIYFLLSLDETALPGQPTDSDPVSGAALYSEYCASCHGTELQGEPDWRSTKADGRLPAPPHDEFGHTWHHGDNLLFSYTKLGGQAALEASGVSGFVSGMPGFADQLTDEEIWNVLAFIKSSWPDRIREMQSERTKGENSAAGAQN